jgi:CMP-N-acetylneuraminic acid synthetase
MANCLILIPARGGSKRLPGKNTREFAGQPLIAWTINAALDSGLNADVVVSTDSPEIAEISASLGAQVPFLRPDYLSSDTASSFDALSYTLETLARAGRHYDQLVLLQPTSPLRQSWHIGEAVAMLDSPHVYSVVSVAELAHPVEWTMELPEDGSLSHFIQHQLPLLNSRSQDLAPRYRLNGAVFAAKIPNLLSAKTFYMPDGTVAYKMEKKYSVDIDDIDDFEYAESLMLKALQGGV